MPNTVTVKEVKARLEDLLDHAQRGEEWTIVDADGQPVAKLAALPATAEFKEQAGDHSFLFGLMRGRLEMSPDFDDPLEDFKAYME